MGISTAALAVLLVGFGGDDTALLEFSATYCGPCRRMEPIVDRLIEEGLPVRKYDLDRDAEMAARYGVQMVPCFIMLKNGKPVERYVGATSEEHLRRMLASAGATPPEPAPTATVWTETPVPVTPNDANNDADKRITETSAPANAEPPKSIWARPGSIRQPTVTAPRDLDDDLLASTVRLRIEEGGASHSVGSGTVVDSRQGEALILTCAHIFRDYAEGGAIDVEFFCSNPPIKKQGRLVTYNEKRDIGLVQVFVDDVPAVRVAPKGHEVGVRESVINIGCNHGDDPTVRHNYVTAINRFEPPANIEVGGQPVLGRSGGGLFCEDGYVIGVCNAANPSDDEGIYAGLDSIHAELDRLNLSFVYEKPTVTSPPLRENVLAATELPRRMPIPTSLSADRDAASTNTMLGSIDLSVLSDEQARTLREIHRRMLAGDEVYCFACPPSSQAPLASPIAAPRSPQPPTRSLAPPSRSIAPVTRSADGTAPWAYPTHR